jgi:hypothetical protein
MGTPAAVVEITGNAQVKTGPGSLVSVLLTAGTDAASIILYDNTAGSGKVICTLKAPLEDSREWSPADPAVFTKGVNAVVSGTSPLAYIVTRK